MKLLFLKSTSLGTTGMIHHAYDDMLGSRIIDMMYGDHGGKLHLQGVYATIAPQGLEDWKHGSMQDRSFQTGRRPELHSGRKDVYKVLLMVP